MKNTIFSYALLALMGVVLVTPQTAYAEAAPGGVVPPSVSSLPAPIVEEDQIVINANDHGDLTTYTINGKPSSLVEGPNKVDLGGGLYVEVIYDSIFGFVTVKNECNSKGNVGLKILGLASVLTPCEEKTIYLSTADEGNTIPENLDTNESTENPDEGREPISPILN